MAIKAYFEKVGIVRVTVPHKLNKKAQLAQGPITDSGDDHNWYGI